MTAPEWLSRPLSSRLSAEAVFALCVQWDGRPVDPSAERRIAGSLGAGTRLAARGHDIAPGIFAATLGLAECRSMPSGGTLLFHGHLQNRATLRDQLGAHRGDAALYAAARERWGEDADTRVIGAYAAVIVDPAGPRVDVTRAALQAPPLHWHRGRGELLLGSVARALFATGTLTPQIDEQKIADSLYLNYTEAERSWYKGVSRLAIGRHARHTADRVVETRYYDLARLPAIRLKRYADYVEAASALLAEGTRAALDGYRRPAIALSGGLDSQAVAVHALATLAPGTELLGLTGVPEAGWDGVEQSGSFGDERAHVAALAALYPALRCETVDAAGRSFDHRLGEMFFHAGGPPRNAMNLHWLHALHARARANGCDVLLTGAMGNLSFSFDGSGALASWFARGAWLRLASAIDAVRGSRSFARAVLSEAIRPHLSDTLIARIDRWRRTGVRELPAWCPLDPTYARAMHVAERAGRGVDKRSARAWRLTVLNGVAGEAGDLEQAMETIHGIPLRDPTAYRPLVEFCLGIPDAQFWKGAVRRRLARRMLRGRIPDHVVDETRIGAQAADWHVRLSRERAALGDEIAALRGDPTMARRFDLDRLGDALAAWPTRTLDGAERQRLQLALPRALATARFIYFVEGTNAGAQRNAP